MWKEYVHED